MNNIFLPKNEIFDTLKTYLEANSTYKPFVFTRVVEKKLPLVVFEEPRNELAKKSTDFKFKTRLLNYNINIYATDIGNVSSNDICEEIAELVIEVMEGHYNMHGGITACMQRFDGNSQSYRVNLRFTTEYNASYRKLI